MLMNTSPAELQVGFLEGVPPLLRYLWERYIVKVRDSEEILTTLLNVVDPFFILPIRIKFAP